MDPVLTSPPPSVTGEFASGVCSSHWGIVGSAHLLEAERDRNFLIKATDGSRYLLKLSNPAEDPVTGNLQTSALVHLAHRDRDLPVPRIIPTPGGEFEIMVALTDGRETMARVMSFLEGAPLLDHEVTVELAESIGTALARLDVAFSDFDHPAGHHDLLWDLRKIPELEPLLQHIRDNDMRALAGAWWQYLSGGALSRLEDLAPQMIHNDVNPSNILVRQGAITGIIDFGDMMRAPRVQDPAVSFSYLLEDSPDPFRLARAATRLYVKVIPLDPDERAVLPHLMVARRLLSVMINNWLVELFPENTDHFFNTESEAWAVLRKMEPLKHDLEKEFWGPM